MMQNIFIIALVVVNYIMLPLAMVFLCLELYLTKKRVGIYEKALHDIADQAPAAEPAAIKGQRDVALATARLALYDPSLPSARHTDG